MSETSETIVTVLLIILIPLMVVGVIAIVASVQKDDGGSIKAFCQSIEGAYGGGKCYKDGVEMKVEK